MKLAWNISLALTIAGVVAFAISMITHSTPLLGVIGLLLIVAGVVKIIMVRIWVAFFKVDPFSQPTDHSPRG
jgi:hypothetical protein